MIHFEINGSKKSIEWNGETPNQMWIGERDRPNSNFLKDPAVMLPEAAHFAGTPSGLGEGYLDTFKNLFRDVYQRIGSGSGMIDDDREFPTFETGYRELRIVAAILESNETRQWAPVPKEKQK